MVFRTGFVVVPGLVVVVTAVPRLVVVVTVVPGFVVVVTAVTRPLVVPPGGGDVVWGARAGAGAAWVLALLRSCTRPVDVDYSNGVDAARRPRHKTGSCLTHTIGDDIGVRIRPEPRLVLPTAAGAFEPM